MTTTNDKGPAAAGLRAATAARHDAIGQTDKSDSEGAYFLTRSAGALWARQVRAAAQLNAKEMAERCMCSGQTIAKIEQRRPTSQPVRVMVWRTLCAIARDEGMGTTIPVLGKPADADAPAAVVVEQDGQTRMETPIDVMPQAWLRDLIALHDAIGDKALVSGPKVKHVLATVIRDLGGEV